MSENAIGTGTTRGNDGEYAAISDVLMRCKPTRGRCIILVDPLPETYNDGASVIVTPEALRDELKPTMTGVILAMGAPQTNSVDITGHLEWLADPVKFGKGTKWADVPAFPGDRVLFQSNVQYGDYRRVVVVTQSSLLAVLEPQTQS